MRKDEQQDVEEKKYLVDEVGAVVDLASDSEVKAVLGVVCGQVGGGEGLDVGHC